MLRARKLDLAKGATSLGRGGSALEFRGAKDGEKGVRLRTKGGKVPSRKHLEDAEPLECSQFGLGSEPAATSPLGPLILYKPGPFSPGPSSHGLTTSKTQNSVSRRKAEDRTYQGLRVVG